MIKQLGSLMMHLLPKMAKVLVRGVVRLAKLFILSIKNAKLEDAEESGEEDQGEDDQKLHRNAGNQAKSCLRKSLSLIKDIYRKFSYEKAFITDFSKMVHEDVI